MEQQQSSEPETANTKKKVLMMVIGALLSIGLSILLLRYFNIINQNCCGLGFLIVACVTLYVPKMFGMSKTKYLAIFGVVLFLILTLAGTFVYAKPMYEENSKYSEFNSNGFTNVNIEYNGGNLTVTVSYSGSGTVVAHLTRLELMTSKSSESPMEGTGTYTCTFSNVERDFIYSYYFEAIDGETKTTSNGGYYLDIVSDSELNKSCFFRSLTLCTTIILIFYIMLILTAVMRRNLEKTRARMEAEGRLYPQGYGRCKECGSIVLPGETCCRKCGAYIDVPDELRHRKVDMVKCSECGAEIPEDANVCPKCGATFDEEEEIVYVDPAENRAEKKVELVQCSECGEMIPEDAEVCPKCGAKFDEEEEIVVAEGEKKE